MNNILNCMISFVLGFIIAMFLGASTSGISYSIDDVQHTFKLGVR